MKQEDSLAAKLMIIRNDSFLESLKYLKRFVEYERKNSIDVVVAELPEALAERMQKAMNGPEESYHFSKTGHLGILFHYIRDTQISTHYTTIEKLPKVLKKVKKQMKAKKQNSLYQICMKDNQETVKQHLAYEGFKLK